MNGVTTTRLLGGLVLFAAVCLVAGDPPTALAQKKKKKQAADPVAPVAADPTKRSAPAVAPLPESQRLSAERLAQRIDRLIADRLAAEKVPASPRCSDEEFVRRVYLDLAGRVPTAEQAARFLDSKEPNRRARLIDELLADANFGKHQADVWQALLLPRLGENRRLMQWYPNLTKWLEERFNQNAPWSETVKALLTASGPVDQPNPVIYWVANPTVDKVTDNISRLFLGVQLECAQCHNHPFTDYKRDEYWGMAAFFLKVAPDGNPKGAAKKGGSISISERGRQPNRKRLPDSAKIVPAKFLQGEQPALRPADLARPVLADWLATPTNPFFARAMVNRVWHGLFGRGIVMPVDDMHEGHPPSHPELLTELSRQFAASGFDVKYLVRAICNSDTYQRSSKPHGTNADAAPELYARMAIRPLSPAQMYDSLQQIVAAGGQGPGARRGKAARQAPNAREAFVTFFQVEDNGDPTEYQTGIPQVLRLMNAPVTNNAGLGPVVRDSADRDRALEKLYLTVLARRPTAEERDRVAAYLRTNTGEPRNAHAGVLWALLNSSEFALNR